MIKNLSDAELSYNEISVLKLGLKHINSNSTKAKWNSCHHGRYLWPNGTTVSLHIVWAHLKNIISKQLVKNPFKSFNYSYLFLDFKICWSDHNKMKILRNLKERCMILKPNVRKGIIPNNQNKYYNLQFTRTIIFQ